MDLNDFRTPPTILRPAPFWAINDRIEPGEIARQMDEMTTVGLSGGFFHSRAGLTTEYMGEEWFACMEAAIKMAEEKDGYLWLYDEDLWPSGNAGGRIARLKDEYRSATLTAMLVAAGEPTPIMSPDQAIRFAYVIKNRVGVELSDYEQLPIDEIESSIDTERLFIVRGYEPKTGWWSGESYANLLHPEVTSKFIEFTHEKYAARLGQHFGKRVPGIFTDEPMLVHNSDAIAWYEGLPELYALWHNRDFAQDIPRLFFEGSESRLARLLIYRTIHRQFAEAYCRPLYEWCEAHGLAHTGHFLYEDTLLYQTQVYGGTVQSFYRYEHIPGIDHLCRQIAGMLVTCKQVTSATRQLGRKQVLTEIFGVTRHTTTFEDFKWLGDFDLVMGATFFCPHLSWYSARGKRKRDYPPVWNYQQTYWRDLKPLNDYFTRIAYTLTRGEPVCDVVMLHPIDSARAACRPGVVASANPSDGVVRHPVGSPHFEPAAINELDAEFRKALDSILTTGRDCDLGDESDLDDMGRIDGSQFVIGIMRYSVVVLPQATTWRPETLALLKRFVETGGKVVVIGKSPTELDCVPSAGEWTDFLFAPNVLSVPSATRAIQDAVDALAPKRCSLRLADGAYPSNTYTNHRIDGSQQMVFVVNSDHDSLKEYEIVFHGSAGRELGQLDPVTGDCETAKCETRKNDLVYRFTLAPCGSILLNLREAGTEDTECVSVKDTPCCQPRTVMPLPEEFEFKRCDDNVLVLDRLQVSYDGGTTFGPENLDFRVRRSIAEYFGTSDSLAWQPWVAIEKGLFDGKGGKIVLRYTFDSDIEKPCASIVIEDIEKGRLRVNGHSVATLEHDWHWDHGFGKVKIGEWIVKGTNVVDFDVDYDFLTEVEAAYVVGDFGVEMADPYRGRLVNEPLKLRVGSWTNQGYPFYSGRMVYVARFDSKEGNPVVLKLVRPSGTLFNIRVNGEDAGRILWRPFEIDLSRFVKPGSNLLEIEVVSSLQNSWGPLHEKIGDDFLWCGPNAFESDPIIREEMNIFNYGLIGGGELIQ